MTEILPNKTGRSREAREQVAARDTADLLRLPGGRRLTLRFVTPQDIAPLMAYLQSQSQRSRANRFLGIRHELTDGEVTRMLRTGEDHLFAVIGELTIDGADRIVCEARYAFDPETQACEFGLSVGDAWHGLGIGTAVLSNLECRAAAFGARRMLGDTFRDNKEMLGLARKNGFAFVHSPDDWRLVRVQKTVGHMPQDIPCLAWRSMASAA